MAVYIANLGKYNEGDLVGAWFTFPIDDHQYMLHHQKQRNHDLS